MKTLRTFLEVSFCSSSNLDGGRLKRFVSSMLLLLLLPIRFPVEGDDDMRTRELNSRRVNGRVISSPLLWSMTSCRASSKLGGGMSKVISDQCVAAAGQKDSGICLQTWQQYPESPSL